ncbi:MAG: hypothetical protein ACW986_17100 [Promethearchaeota archaeon]|jgi:hypothetical protein
MIDVGGKNLPKAIASKSGAKLGKLYKGKGFPLNIEAALTQIYSVLNAKPSIKQLDEISYEVTTRYPKKFCPIGGSNNSSRALLFQENICIPYTKGFLNEIFPNNKFEEKIINCIPLNNHKTCHYILKVEKRNSTG